MGKFRFTGLSTPLGGVDWEYKDDDREIARRTLNLLEDRRMLWKDFSMEIEEQCVASADRMRSELGTLINTPGIGDTLESRLKLMRQIFRDFMSEVGSPDDRWRHPHHPMGTDPLSMALGRLRALMGVQVGLLAAEYDLDVSDELASIVPDQSGWFFEKFK